MTYGVMPLTAQQLQVLETEVAVLNSAIDELEAMQLGNLDAVFRTLLAVATPQLRLGLGSLEAMLKLAARMDARP